MFPGLKPGEWEPVYVRERVKTKDHNGTTKADASHNDVEMVETTHDGTYTNGVSTHVKPEPGPSDAQPVEDAAESEYYDDPSTISTATYPMQAGRVVDYPCFFALLTHIYHMISPPFHMPILLVAQPCWTARDREILTQYFFENWKIPALCIIDAALAATWGFGVPSATVIDVGLDKCDVSAVVEYVVQEVGRGVSVSDCGGSALSARIQAELCKNQEQYPGVHDFGDLAEQIKRSPICEILPATTALPGKFAVEAHVPNPLVAASTAPVPGNALSNAALPILDGNSLNNNNNNEEDDNEGVLDVAAIVAQSNAAEVLAKREREKAEKDAKKKGQAAEQARIRLRNADRERNNFTYEEPVAVIEDGSSPSGTEGRSRKRKREMEVGLERFMAATASAGHVDGVLDRIAGAVHSTIMSVPDISQRSTLWENLIILGNGSRVRGFPAALVETLSTRYTLSPSNATIFTSELPSNFSTPVPTGGTNTPIPGQQGHHHPSGVNPLLVAATKNMMVPSGAPQHLAIPGQFAGQLHGGAPQYMENMQSQSYRGISQTPTTMKTVKAPEYFPEWKVPGAAGMEDAAFLGAQVAAKVVFIVDQGMSKGFLTRSEYNELGPEGIHGCSM